MTTCHNQQNINSSHNAKLPTPSCKHRIRHVTYYFEHGLEAYNISKPNPAPYNPSASGASRWVTKWVYTSGARSGQVCVLKWFKMGAVFEDDYFALEIKGVDRVLYTAHAVFCNRMVICNCSAWLSLWGNFHSIWRYSGGSAMVCLIISK